jgi:hypothetical protein
LERRSCAAGGGDAELRDAAVARAVGTRWRDRPDGVLHDLLSKHSPGSAVSKDRFPSQAAEASRHEIRDRDFAAQQTGVRTRCLPARRLRAQCRAGRSSGFLSLAAGQPVRAATLPQAVPLLA